MFILALQYQQIFIKSLQIIMIDLTEKSSYSKTSIPSRVSKEMFYESLASCRNLAVNLSFIGVYGSLSGARDRQGNSLVTGPTKDIGPCDL